MRVWSGIFFLFSVLLALTLIRPAINPIDASSLQMVVGSYEVEMYSSVNVSVVIIGAEGIAGGSMKMIFDKSLVIAEEVTSGDFGDPIANVNNTEGFVHVAVSKETGVGKANATLAVFRYRGIKEGDTQLYLEQAELNDEQGNLVTPEVIHGSIHVISTLATSRVHNLDTGLNYTAIQEAIDDPQTSKGNRIFVEKGTYYENVVITKSISLLGEDRNNTIIDGQDRGHVIDVRSSHNVTINGFTIRNSGHWSPGTLGGQAGVCVEQYSDNCTVSQNRIESNNHKGIWVRDSKGCSILQNEVRHNNGEGIEVQISGYCTIRANIVSNNSVHGISVWAFENCTVADNVVTDNGEDGISLDRSDSNSIFGNTVINNKQHGITIGLSSGKVFHNNFITNYPSWYPVHQAFAYNSTIEWDDGYPSGGNYWSDYNGPDLFRGSYQNENGPDGMGDQAYGFDDGQDGYPLMGQFSSLYVTSATQVQTVCNSTVSDLRFNGTAILFKVTGEESTIGFCRICVPKSLLNGVYRVVVNDREVQHELLPCPNTTHSFLYFEYTHSTQDVIVIPEFVSLLPLLLFVIVTASAVMVHTRRYRRKRDT